MYFVYVVLIGDADDTVNIELATTGNGEVVGNMCNRNRYVLRYFSRAPAFLSDNLRGLDLVCQHSGSANISHLSFIFKIPFLEDNNYVSDEWVF